jgi:hypothetical protein
MKLFYQSMGVARRSGSGPYARALSSVLRDAAEPGTEIDLHDLGPGKAFAGVHRVDGVPVVNGLIALTKMAEMAVRIGRLTGAFTSKRMMYAPPSGTLLADIRAAYGDHVYPGAT